MNILDNLLAQAAATATAATVEAADTVSLTEEGLLRWEFAFSYETKDSVKGLAGAKFHGKSKPKFWTTHPSHDAKAVIERYAFDVSPEAAEVLDAIPTPVDRTEASSAIAPLEPYTGALAADLFEYQKAGVQYILGARRVLVGDEMGLGKTRQAIAAIETEKAFPAIVVCPSGLTENWKKEWQALVADRTVAIVQGVKNITEADKDAAFAADVVILGYGSLRMGTKATETDRAPAAGWARVLEDHAVSFVADESHYLKNPDAQRTQAASSLVDHLDDDALILALTGTPVLNRPAEFVPQLTLLGRLADTGYTSSFAWLKFYCSGQQGARGWDFSGASNMDLLNDRMRSSFYLRRLKADTLTDLSAKLDALYVNFSLGSALRQYNRAKSDIIAWTRANGGAEAAAKAARAEVLVKMNALLRLAGEAKVDATIEWVEDFLAQNPEKKVVVFAKFRAVQDALVEYFECPAILGGQPVATREAEKARFNDGDKMDDADRVIIVSLGAGREGHTLLGGGRCSDVVLVEQGWTPAEMNQAEDRVHRIGQEAAVTPWYLIAAGTIDEDIRALIAAKKIVVDAATEGGDFASDTDSIALAAFMRLNV